MQGNGTPTWLWEPPDRDRSAENGGLGVAERRMLEQGKKEHRETTASTKRALKIAEQTTEIATATLVAVQHQGTILDAAERDVVNVCSCLLPDLN